MSTKKENTQQENKLKELPNEILNAGRDLWLAGLGAFATVEQEGASIVKDLSKQGDRFVDNLQSEANRLFRNFIERGEQMENEGRRRLTGIAEEAEAQQKKVTRTVEDLVSDAVEKALGAVDMPTRTEVMALTRKVEKLTAQVDALATTLTTGPAPATPEVTPDVERTMYNVVSHEDGWAVVKVGNERATSVHATKVEAVEAGRELARTHEPSQLVILKKDGTVQDTNVYG